MYVALFKSVSTNCDLRALERNFLPLMQTELEYFTFLWRRQKEGKQPHLIYYSVGTLKKRNDPVMEQEENTFLSNPFHKVLVSTYFVPTLCSTL